MSKEFETLKNAHVKVDPYLVIIDGFQRFYWLFIIMKIMSKLIVYYYENIIIILFSKQRLLL